MPLENVARSSRFAGWKGSQLLVNFWPLYGRDQLGFGPAAAPDAAARFDKRQWEFSPTLLNWAEVRRKEKVNWVQMNSNELNSNRSESHQDRNPFSRGWVVHLCWVTEVSYRAATRTGVSCSRTLQQSGLRSSCMLRTAWAGDIRGLNLTTGSRI